MAKQGMDVDQIESDGTQMKSVGSDAIPHLISSIEGIVQQIQGTWHGDDANTFVNNWNTTLKSHLTTIAGAVQSHGELAMTNAREQRDTSSAGSTL